jgi:hypothetical protein
MANFYMEYFKETTLRKVQWKQTHWFRIVDDIFEVWPDGEGKL